MLRAPPGLTNRKIVASVKPAISLLNMFPEEQMFGPNPPLQRRKSEETARAEDDPTSRHYKGGGKWEGGLKPCPHGVIFAGRDLIQKRNGRAEMSILPTLSQKRVF